MSPRIDCLSLADGQLGFRNLYRPDANFAQQYNQLLKSLLGLDNPTTDFSVGLGGVSPELQQRFGRRYLAVQACNPLVFILSPDQAKAPMLESEFFSFEGVLLRKVYEAAADEIASVTQQEILWGEIENDLTTLSSLDDLLLLRQARITLETSRGSLQKILQLQRMHHSLDQHYDENAFLQRMLSMAKELDGSGGLRYGDVRRFRLHEKGIFPVALDVDSFYTHLLGGVYVVREKVRRKMKTLILHSQDDAPHDDTESVSYLNIKEPDILDTLRDNGLLDYRVTSEMVDAQLQALEMDLLLRENIDLVSAPYEANVALKRLMAANPKKMGKAWWALRALKKRQAAGYDVQDYVTQTSVTSDSELYEIKLRFAVPLKEEQVIGRLLTNLYDAPSVTAHDINYIRMFHWNPERLFHEFESYTPARKRFVCAQLGASLTDSSLSLRKDAAAWQSLAVPAGFPR